MTVEPDTDPGVLMLETHEGGSTTVVFNELALAEKGVLALHVVGGSVYALMDDMKLHKFEEVKGFQSAARVREIKPASD